MTVTRDEWDEACGLWRWPEGENFVVRETPNAYFVIDEVGRKESFWAKELVSIIGIGDHGLAAQALRAYLDSVRKTSKPWLDAKPGEVWVLSCPRLHSATSAYTFRGGMFRSGESGALQLTDSNITAGRRIWPEVADV